MYSASPWPALRWRSDSGWFARTTTVSTRPAPRVARMSDAALLGGPPEYNEAVVRKFIIAAVFWAVVAFLVGVYIASEMSWPALNFGLPWLNFGRLRPVHTSAAI